MKNILNIVIFSFLFDTKNLLREKESPFDRGKKVFENLLENRVKIKKYVKGDLCYLIFQK